MSDSLTHRPRRSPYRKRWGTWWRRDDVIQGCGEGSSGAWAPSIGKGRGKMINSRLQSNCQNIKIQKTIR